MSHTFILSFSYTYGEIVDSLEKIFGNTAQMTVLKNLIEHQNDLTYLSRIAKETELSQSIVSKVIKPLVISGIVIEKPLGKLIRTFQLNMESEATRLIIDFQVPLQKIMILKQKFSFTTKNIIKQNISQITSRFRQLFRITGL